MAMHDFSHYFLYRWRYVIGYTFIGLLLAGLLVFAGLYLPGGLSTAEMTSVVRSASLSITDPATLAIQNLPYYAFQAAIFSVFGVSVFTIKLASLLIALVSAVGLVFLLRRWFKPNIAVLASLIAITTGQFLFIAQSGTPSVLYIFWPVTLLLLGTQITRAKRFRFLWKILFAIFAALSLYTPLSLYPLIAISLAIAFHPHLRNIVRRLRRPRIVIVSLIFLLLITPLVWLITLSPQLGLTLLGIPRVWPPDITANTMTVFAQYFLFWEASTTEVMMPVFGLGSAILISLGAYRLVRTRETTRSYLIIFWIVCLMPVLLLNPSFTSVTFVPSVLMLAAGITSLIGYWYRLFPLNPYARMAGLVPIVILVVALITSGLGRYIYGYHYDPQVAPQFSKDLTLLPKDTMQLVVADSEQAFYSAVASYRDGLIIVTTPTKNSFVMTRLARIGIDGYEVKNIITNSLRGDSDRFYVMQLPPVQATVTQ
ncbi:MAG: ArnT family glycosyltransferase [Candidatus Saccharimonadaceae bacterium]